MRNRVLAALTALVFAAPAAAAPVLMSPDWAKDACAAWNDDPVLTDKLAESGWAKNDKGRGFKVMQLYRSDCGDTPTAEMRIALKDEKAMCVYGGAPETAKLDSGADYVMNAETTRWIEMGRGDYGPMAAMMLRRLGFDGPRLEAMGNMGPFASFLRLVGKVPGETSACPAK
ncbi:MAG: SCP2 sterol-binding domain-containing protein [Proteobacteria bacterium]|jgi:putative sterol carrier protein|nr:SCP2 sterol-binding domain-containing protein [Pseudomonadota bacterium]